MVLRVREKKREGIERKKERPKLCCSKSVLIHRAWAYILSYKVLFSAKTKIKLPDLQNRR